MNRSLSPRFQFNTDKIAGAAVTLAPIVYFLPALLAHLVLGPNDGMLFNIPLRVTTANLLRAGELPLWNPYIFGGMPLFATAQGGLLFPLNWFYLIFSPPVATNLMVVTTYMLAGLGIYLFARRTGSSVTGSVVSAIIWEMGGFLIAQLSHINIAHTAAMLPWVLWSIERYVETGSRRRGALIAVLVAVQIFAGHQQTFAYTFLLLCAYSLVMSFGNKEFRQRYLFSIAFAIVGVFLGAVQIIPTFELLRWSVRSTASYEFFTSFSMPLSFVTTLLAPYVMGGGDGRLFRAPYIGDGFYIEIISYAGILAVMLSVISLLLKPERKTKFWAIVVLVGLMLSSGQYLPFGLYRVFYFVPVLNLFRVPARHLVEVDFALAILAGHGISSLAKYQSESSRWFRYRVGVVAIATLVLTVSIVTWLRPANFRLSREAPVTLLRAPELFMPIVIALLSAWAIWAFANRWRRSTAGVVAVLVLDLVLWGQFSGWYFAATKVPAEYWKVPESVELLRSQAGPNTNYRILTSQQSFNPDSSFHSLGWLLWTEPDVYSMFGIANVAGYDGFGLRRYSELAGQMKLWGELPDPNATLRSDSREIDILNARYLIARRDDQPEPTDKDEEVTAPTSAFPAAPETYNGIRFSSEDLGLPNLTSKKLFELRVPPVKVDHIAIISNLSWADLVPDGAVVGHFKLNSRDGRSFEFDLRAGIDTADWAYDRPDIRAKVRHKRPTVAIDYDVSDSQYKYKGHKYVSSFVLPEKVIVESGHLSLEARADSPDLFLSLFRVSLFTEGEGSAYAVSREMISVETTDSAEAKASSDNRWRHVAAGRHFDIYENARALPRAWMTAEVMVLSEPEMLRVIRTGVLPNGSRWAPSRSTLIETRPRDFQSSNDDTGEAKVNSYTPNRIDLSAHGKSSSFLVLSENYYPGWRAYVDGQPVELMRANYNLRGLVVPSGEHHITFVYRPQSVVLGLVISLLTAVGLAVMVKHAAPQDVW